LRTVAQVNEQEILAALARLSAENSNLTGRASAS
jgi:hypothetical protein